MTPQEAKYQRMTTEPVSRLVTSLAIPSMGSMMVSALYNIVDTYFVSQTGTQATAALGVVFTYMVLRCGFHLHGAHPGLLVLLRSGIRQLHLPRIGGKAYRTSRTDSCHRILFGDVLQRNAGRNRLSFHEAYTHRLRLHSHHYALCLQLLSMAAPRFSLHLVHIRAE